MSDLKSLCILLYKNSIKQEKGEFLVFQSRVYDAMDQRNHTADLVNAVKYLFEKVKSLGMVLSAI